MGKWACAVPTQLLLKRDGRTLVTIPVPSPGEEGSLGAASAEPLLKELVGIFSIASNERRLRLMVELMKKPETRFTDLLQVGVNPKLVQDCVGPMVESGLLIHEGKRAGYSPSPKGAMVITMVTRGLAELIRAMEADRP